MENVINEVKPGQVVAAIDPAFVDLQEFLRLKREADDYLKDKPDALRLLYEVQDVAKQQTSPAA